MYVIKKPLIIFKVVLNNKLKTVESFILKLLRTGCY